MTETSLLTTPLHALHIELGAKMVPFAGYDMPVQYEGIMAEHLWTRESAGLFDVSHMGQARVTGEARALEALITADLAQLGLGEQKYALLLNDAGGIMDDLMVSRPDAQGWFLVVNAATKHADFAHMHARFGAEATLTEMPERALLALQGPKAAAVFIELCPQAADMVFMQARRVTLRGMELIVSRSGYTGEDGFEISVLASEADALARLLLSDSRVKPIGLGARDSLRLEAGLCLYGHDMDETVTPVEAALTWAISKGRRDAADFPGAATILTQIADGATRKRIGLKLKDRAPAREGAVIQYQGETVGVITSGGFAPSVNGPIAMGYVRSDLARVGTTLDIMVRDKARSAEIVRMPFVEHRFYRG